MNEPEHEIGAGKAKPPEAAGGGLIIEACAMVPPNWGGIRAIAAFLR